MRDELGAKRPCVLVFAGHDPSGGAGIQADIEAIAAQGAHALPVITALTVQDNQRVYAVHPVDLALLRAQAETLLARIPVAAVKIGILGSLAHAQAIAAILKQLNQQQPIPVVLDTVLRSGHGDALSQDDPVLAVAELFNQATLLTPNLPELARLSGATPGEDQRSQIQRLQTLCNAEILLKGGHGSADEDVCNSWWNRDGLVQSWRWPRLPGEFHGSGCTLAAALAGQLAMQIPLAAAMQNAQDYTQASLAQASRIADGQLIPRRFN